MTSASPSVMPSLSTEYPILLGSSFLNNNKHSNQEKITFTCMFIYIYKYI